VIWRRDLGSVDLNGTAGMKSIPEKEVSGAFERLIIYAGVILPTLAILFESQYHLCARNFFDPFPSSAHVLLCAMIPLANLLAWLVLCRNSLQFGLALFANGMAAGVAFLYALMFLPLIPVSLCNIFCLVGLFGLAPSISLSVLMLCGKQLAKAAGKYGTRFQPGQVKHAGHLVILAAVLAVELPSTVTRVAMSMAFQPQSRLQALSVLRSVGSQEVMLRSCYERSGRATDVLGSLWEVSHPPNVEVMRKLFYTVTGRLFNSIPIPDSARATMVHAGTVKYDGFDQGARDEFDRDPDVAGEMVSGVSRGLSVCNSRISAQIDSDACVSQMDWFLDFNNKSKFDREVRSRIRLPHGAAVNKAALIVNGKEFECQITLREEARQIYRAAVESKRNPLLVSLSGEDTVLVQCYPVPPGNKLSLHLGVAAPLLLNREKQAVFALPQFEERNFQIAVPHTLALSANHEFLPGTAQMKPGSSGGKFTLCGSLDSAALASGAGIVTVRRGAGGSFWCRDEFSRQSIPGRLTDSPKTIEQLSEKKLQRPSSLTVLIDGSQNMAAYITQISRALSKLPPQVKVELVCVGDSGATYLQGSSVKTCFSGSRDFVELLKSLERFACVGGQINGDVLYRAVRQEYSRSGGAVLWLHGPQPFESGFESATRQLLNDPMRAEPILYDMQLSSGPNLCLDGVNSDSVVRVDRFGSCFDDLSLLFEQWQRPGLLSAFVFNQSVNQSCRQSLPADWRAQIAGQYLGCINDTKPISTVFLTGKDGRISGSYVGKDEDVAYSGRLTDGRCVSAGDRHFVFNWQDRFGKGIFDLTFDPFFKSFKGCYSGAAEGQWSGSRQNPLFSAGNAGKDFETLPAAEPAETNAGAQTMKQLSQLQAYGKIVADLRQDRQHDALATAARYHLVTPVSSAVLVDTIPDFDRMSCPQTESHDDFSELFGSCRDAEAPRRYSPYPTAAHRNLLFPRKAVESIEVGQGYGCVGGGSSSVDPGRSHSFSRERLAGKDQVSEKAYCDTKAKSESSSREVYLTPASQPAYAPGVSASPHPPSLPFSQPKAACAAIRPQLRVEDQSTSVNDYLSGATSGTIGPADKYNVVPGYGRTASGVSGVASGFNSVAEDNCRPRQCEYVGFTANESGPDYSGAFRRFWPFLAGLFLLLFSIAYRLLQKR
jgi:hypothetical protein